MIGKPYIRKKGSKYIIERKEEGRTVYIMTLPPVETLIKTFRPDALEVEASEKPILQQAKEAQEFVYQLLTDPTKEDALKKKTLTDEELERLNDLSR